MLELNPLPASLSREGPDLGIRTVPKVHQVQSLAPLKQELLTEQPHHYMNQHRLIQVKLH